MAYHAYVLCFYVYFLIRKVYFRSLLISVIKIISGKEVKCPDGQGSENGFTPGCITLPLLTVLPVVTAGLVEVAANPTYNYSRKSYFECEFNQSNTGLYYFDIIWYINENEVRRTTNVRYADLSTTRLLPEHWVHQYNLNMAVR